MFLPKETLEESAYKQVENMATLPFVDGLAVMPDAHMGMGACVGSVIATKGAIIPAAVGVDIGCGMIAVKTKFTLNDLPSDLEKVRNGIERRIPLSAGNFNKKIDGTALERVNKLAGKTKDYYKTIVRDWTSQLGTLGSGNHFIELSLDQNDALWVVLHSGSRGIGNKLAEKHIKIAQKMMDSMFITLVDKDLAYLPEHTKEFDEYMYDLLWAQEFARLNREEMMDRVLKELSYTFFNEDGHQQKEIEEGRINCHHNFTQLENHMGKNVWVTRKGAIQMMPGQLGVIPGSMGTRSYIVSGLGNPLSYMSAPHGAGRRFSRSEARRRFTMDDFEREMDGIECRHSLELIDEIPSAYKDIDEVMENSKSLVSILYELRQIVNIKGN